MVSVHRNLIFFFYIWLYHDMILIIKDLKFQSLQSYISGIGNWVADEVLYQVSITLIF